MLTISIKNVSSRYGNRERVWSKASSGVKVKTSRQSQRSQRLSTETCKAIGLQMWVFVSRKTVVGAVEKSRVDS